MKTFFLTVFTLLHFVGFSQQKYSAHAAQFQFEALGPGSLFSVNFDIRFARREKGPGFRVGLGGSPLGILGESCNRGMQISLPVGLNYLIGANTHYLELGAGIVPTAVGGTKRLCIGKEDDFFSDVTQTYKYVLAGYRHQPLGKKGSTYRIFLSPLFQSGFRMKFWGGVSAGVRW